MEWASIILFVERRIPDALRNRSKRLQTGEPGKELGFPDDEEFYLVALEKVPWNLSTNKKNYRSILRRAIKLVYYQVLFWKFKKPKTSEEKPVGEEEEEEEDEENNISKKRPSRIAEEKKENEKKEKKKKRRRRMRRVERRMRRQLKIQLKKCEKEN